MGVIGLQQWCAREIHRQTAALSWLEDQILSEPIALGTVEAMWLSSKGTKCAASYTSMILVGSNACWDLVSSDYCESIGWST